MKRYIPIKYILGMIAIFIIIPITMIILMLAVVGENDFTIAISIFFGFLVLAGPFVYIKNQENASIVIDNHTITNYMNDGTQNFGWSEDIKK